MDELNTQRLLERFNSGQISDEDQREIEALLEAGVIDLSDLKEAASLQEQVSALTVPDTTPRMDRRFYDMLAQHKQNRQPPFWTRFFSWNLLSRMISRFSSGSFSRAHTAMPVPPL